MKTATGFFLFLTGLAVISILLLYVGIEKRKHANPWWFANQTEKSLFSNNLSVEERVVMLADSAGGRALIWLLAATVPIASGILCFKHEQMAAGLLLLMVWAVPVAFFGIVFWISSLVLV